MIKVQIGEWEVIPEKFIIKKNDNEIQVKSLCMKILWCLIEHDGAVVSKDTLIEKCWDGRIVSDDAVRQAIKELRDYLGCNGYESSYIETVRKQGYRLISKIEPINEACNETNTPPVVPLKNIYLKSFFNVKFIIASLLTLSALLISYCIVQNKTYNLSDSAFTVTYESERVLDYHKSALNWDAFTILNPGASFGKAINIRDSNKQLVHSITPLYKDGHVSNPAFSPNGKYLSYLDYQRDHCSINVIDVITKNTIKAIKCSKSDFFIALDWQNNNSLYYSSSPNESTPLSLQEYNLSTGEKYKLTSPLSGGRGDYLTRFCENKGLVLRNVDGVSTEVLTFDVDERKMTMLRKFNQILSTADWMPDCSGIALYLQNKGLYSLSLSNGEMTNIDKKIKNVKTLTVNDSSIYISAGELFNVDINLFDIDNNKTKKIITSNGSNTHFTKRQNSDHYVYISNKTGLPQIWKNEEGNDLQLTQFTRYVNLTYIDWFNDSEFIYFSGENSVWKLNIKTGHLKEIFTSNGLISSIAITQYETLLFTSFVNDIWQGYTLNLKTLQATPLDNISIKELRRSADNKFYFRTPDEQIFQYNIELKKNIFITVAPENCSDWTLNEFHFYCLANSTLLEKNISNNKIKTLLSYQANMGVRFLYHPQDGFYIEQTRTGTLNVQDFHLTSSYF